MPKRPQRWTPGEPLPHYNEGQSHLPWPMKRLAMQMVQQLLLPALDPVNRRRRSTWWTFPMNSMEIAGRFAQYLDSIGSLTPAHRTALFVARMESARSAYAKGDAELAAHLYVKARGTGRWWLGRSGALPLYYRMALLLFGFKRAELLAELRRRWMSHGRSPSPQRQ